MKATYKIIQKTDFSKKDGTNPICHRLTINRKVKKYSLNISFRQDHWNKAKHFVKDLNNENRKLNLIIFSTSAKAKKILFDYELNSKVLTFINFE